MPSAAFHQALPFILRWEGGFVDDPDDPGGRTNKGVTQKTYDAWRARQGLPARDVKGIDGAEVAAIYEQDYWLPPGCDRLPAPLDLVQLDTAVNMGVKRSIRILQAALDSASSGVFDAQTEAAVAAVDAGVAAAGYCDVREGVYESLIEKNAKLAKFRNGWLNRLNALRKEAGVPGFESARGMESFPGAIARIPDLRDSDTLERWR